MKVQSFAIHNGDLEEMIKEFCAYPVGHTIFKIQDKFLHQICNTGGQWLCIFGWGAEKDGRQSVIRDGCGRSLWTARLMDCTKVRWNVIVDVVNL